MGTQYCRPSTEPMHVAIECKIQFHPILACKQEAGHVLRTNLRTNGMSACHIEKHDQAGNARDLPVVQMHVASPCKLRNCRQM